MLQALTFRKRIQNSCQLVHFTKRGAHSPSDVVRPWPHVYRYLRGRSPSREAGEDLSTYIASAETELADCMDGRAALKGSGPRTLWLWAPQPAKDRMTFSECRNGFCLNIMYNYKP